MAVKFFPFVSYASLFFLCAHGFNCSDEDAELMKCFEDVGVKLETSFEESMEVADIFLSEAQSMCGNLRSYQNAAACLVDMTLQCSSQSYADYLPSINSINSVMTTMCESITVIKFDCLLSVDPTLIQCGVTKMSSYKSDGNELASLCFFLQAAAECVIEALHTCGCQTTKLFVEILKMLKPPACSSIPVSTPVCRSGTDEFDSAANVQRMSVLHLFVFALCILYGKM